MPRVNSATKNKAGKKIACGRCNTPIKSGEKYFFFTFRYGGKHYRCAGHYPRASELTQSKMSGVYAAQESVEDQIADSRATMADNFNKIFELVTGIPLHDAIDAKIKGREEEVLQRISQHARDAAKNPLEEVVSEPIDQSDEAPENSKPTVMYICEIAHLILHPGQAYKFIVGKNCQACKDYFGKKPAGSGVIHCMICGNPRIESGGVCSAEYCGWSTKRPVGGGATETLLLREVAMRLHILRDIAGTRPHNGYSFENCPATTCTAYREASTPECECDDLSIRGRNDCPVHKPQAQPPTVMSRTQEVMGAAAKRVEAGAFAREHPDAVLALKNAVVPSDREPFFFAIETAGGDWHDGEHCVFGDLQSAQDQVDTMNEELTEEEWFRVVPLYRRAEAGEAKLREALRDVMEWIGNWTPNFVEDAEWPITKAEVDEALAAPASPAGSDEENYVAYLRFTKQSIVVCDSDSPGAFKVYRHPVGSGALLLEIEKRHCTCSATIKITCRLHERINILSAAIEHQVSLAVAGAYEDAAQLCDERQKDFEGTHGICEFMARDIRKRTHAHAAAALAAYNIEQHQRGGMDAISAALEMLGCVPPSDEAVGLGTVRVALAAHDAQVQMDEHDLHCIVGSPMGLKCSQTRLGNCSRRAELEEKIGKDSH